MSFLLTAMVVGPDRYLSKPTMPAAVAARDPKAGKPAQEARGVQAQPVVAPSPGGAGLRSTAAAVEAGKTIGLANKESLVLAGELIMRRARERGVRILPVDSEHSAIHQSLAGHNRAAVRRLILTASGGPLRTVPAAELSAATTEVTGEGEPAEKTPEGETHNNRSSGGADFQPVFGVTDRLQAVGDLVKDGWVVDRCRLLEGFAVGDLLHDAAQNFS